MARARNRYGSQVQTSVVTAGESESWLTRLADLLDAGNLLPWSLRVIDRSLAFIPRYHIVSVTTDTTLTVDNKVVLADPVATDLTITLPDAINGMSIYVKNIDESGTYSLYADPGTNKIDGQPGGAAPGTADLLVSPLDSYELVFFTDTWWVI